MRHLLKYLAVLTVLIINTGCSEVVYCGFAKSSEELNGAVRIATNKKIKVTIDGTDTVSTKDLGGMIAVRSADLAKLIELANAKDR